jgi:hypothetical protein
MVSKECAAFEPAFVPAYADFRRLDLTDANPILNIAHGRTHDEFGVSAAQTSVAPVPPCFEVLWPFQNARSCYTAGCPVRAFIQAMLDIIRPAIHLATFTVTAFPSCL